MERNVIQDKKGFTLIEVMVAFVIILVMMLGLLNLTAQVTAVGVQNTIRDEGIKVAEEIMAQVRGLPYDNIITNPPEIPSSITRNLRNFSMTYSPLVRVTTYAAAKTIDVTVTWQYRGTNFSHTISSLVRSPE